MALERGKKKIHLRHLFPVLVLKPAEWNRFRIDYSPFLNIEYIIKHVFFNKSLCRNLKKPKVFVTFTLKCSPRHNVQIRSAETWRRVRAECHLCVYSSPLWHFISSGGVSLAFHPIDSTDKEAFPVSQQCTSVQLIRCSWETEHWFSVAVSVHPP